MPLPCPPHGRRSILASIALVLALSVGHADTVPARLDLRDGWCIQSAEKTSASAESLASTGFSTEGWYRTTVPATVLAAQVASGEFGDIFHADNFRKLPGMPASPDGGSSNPYASPWWYRTEFRLPPEFKDRNVWLHFNGINTRADIWLNGRKLADASDVAGALRIFELDATPLIEPDAVNTLAVKVYPPTNDDFGINLVDWVPTPPDRNMGLWREAYLTASGPVRVRYPGVFTHFPDASLTRADLSVRVELHNDSDHTVEGTLRGGFATEALQQAISLAPGEHRSVQFTPEEFPQLKIENPQVWWPAGWGEQTLHQLSMAFEIAGAISDEQTCTFGIREITGELHGESPRPGAVFNNNGDFSQISTDERPLVLSVNHRRILIRGGGWCPDMLQRSSPERLRAEFRYLVDMNLNAIRLEGKMESDTFFDLADRMGLLILAGWCCGDIWERWGSWKPGDYTIAYESQRTQTLRLRHHACMALWMNGSDNHPPAEVETTYLKILANNGWPTPCVSSATSVPTEVTGPTGVKMTGPYDYVPPAYWLLDTHQRGGAFGFNTETSPGAAIPDLGSLKKFLPADKLWPVNELWDLHAGAGGLNNNITHFSESMDAIYGPPSGLDDFLRKAQAMAYDGQRAMFEAYGKNKYQSTGLIQWMLNNGWPSVIWHLYDYYLQPAAGYFGTKKACEPLHIQYSYDDRSVVVVNGLIEDRPGLTAEASLLDFTLRPLFSRTVHLDSPADSVQRILTVPVVDSASHVTFVRLTLSDAAGGVVSTNFYWLPRELSTFDWSQEQAKAHPYYTAVKRYEDLTQLNQLPEVDLATGTSAHTLPDGASVSVTVRNPTDHLAFQVHLALVGAESHEELLPVLWEDNYFTLMPGESRTITARYDAGTRVDSLTLMVDGWNVARRPVIVSDKPTEPRLPGMSRVPDH